MAVDVGTATTVVFGTSALGTFEVQNMSWSGMSRESIETTHLGTTEARTFMPGDLYDPGEMTIEVSYDDTVTIPLKTANTAETITVTFPTSSASFAASGFLTGFEVTAALEERMTATCTVKFSGQITGL